MTKTLGPLHIIIDGKSDTLGRWLGELEPGTATVQVRDKALSARELFALAQTALAVTKPLRIPLVVNDRVDVALAVGADGVHLPEHGLGVAAARRLAHADFMIGKSAHSVAAVQAASDADYIVFGPVFDTPGKLAVGIGALKAAVAATERPVYAIGGFADEAEVRAAQTAGARGVAAIRAFAGPEGFARASRFARVFRAPALTGVTIRVSKPR